MHTILYADFEPFRKGRPFLLFKLVEYNIYIMMLQAKKEKPKNVDFSTLLGLYFTYPTSFTKNQKATSEKSKAAL